MTTKEWLKFYLRRKLLKIDSKEPSMKLEEENNDEMIPVKTTLSCVDKVAFIHAVREYPCLWDVTSTDFRDRAKKEHAWQTLSAQFECDSTRLHKCLKNLKENLKRCMDKRKSLSRNGVPTAALPRCQYFEDMLYFNHYKLNYPPIKDGEETDCIGEPTMAEFVRSTCTSESPVRYDILQKQPNTPEHSELQSSSSSHAYSTVSTPSLAANSSSATSTQHEQFHNYSASPSEPSRREKRKRDDEGSDVSFMEDAHSLNGRLLTSISSGDDEDSLWCWSLIPQLKALPLKKKRFAKLKISELLYNIEFDESEGQE